MRFNKYYTTKSLNDVISKCLIFWEKGNIPTQSKHKATKKLMKLYEEWK